MPSMKQYEQETRDVKRLLLVASAVLLLLALLPACKQDRALKADLWNIRASDSSLYRVVKGADGKEYEEFYSIPENPAMSRFACMLDTDRKKWLEYMERNCN